MGTLELWLGPAGGGKTGQALAVLREELDRGWDGVRYLVPTVGHKRSIEHLLLTQGARPGLFGDPVTTFFNFAEEVARRGRVQGRCISETQKHVLLKGQVRAASLDYFARARTYPGFVEALREIIDELKVSMVLPTDLTDAASAACERGAGEFGQKLYELGVLYETYQQRLIGSGLYDNEGIMWIAAQCLKDDLALFGDLRCLILDGFARLTPIQVMFLHTLAPRVGRVIVLFDYEDGRAASYHPVQVSLQQLHQRADDGLQIARQWFRKPGAPRTALACLRAQLFHDAPTPCTGDDTLGLLVAATPAQEAEMIARDVRALLRTRTLPDGTPVAPGEIAILARSADAVRERLVRTFTRYGLPIKQEAPALAHTPVGRALLAAFRLVRDRWKREDVLTLLKSGFLDLPPGLALQVDLTARRHYLRERRATWLEQWPEEAVAAPLRDALAPLAAFDDAYHRHGDAGTLLAAVTTLLQAFQAVHGQRPAPLPNVDRDGAYRAAALEAAFVQALAVVDEFRADGMLLTGFHADEVLDNVLAALVRTTVTSPTPVREGIPVLSAHTTGGEKFKVIYLCGLLEGAFPRHQRESAFLMDHEREENLRDMRVIIEARKHLEEDERYWFLHAVASATHRLVLSYPLHGADGSPLERSSFLDEVEKVVPELPERARTTSFRDVLPALDGVECDEEFAATLAYRLGTERQPERRVEVAAAYAACREASSLAPLLAGLYQRGRPRLAAVAHADTLGQFATRDGALSASELQAYLDCPFLWFGGDCLGVEPLVEEFSPLDRGIILHAVLEKLYRDRQTRPGVPVHLEQYTFDELWPGVEDDLRTRLQNEPQFCHRATFLQDVEWEGLRRMMMRFLRAELERAATRQTHPAFFERFFGNGQFTLTLVDGSALRGKIDRIDLCDTDPRQAVVVDYKASARMSLKDLEAGKLLQAPVYALALQRSLHLQPLGVEFMGLKQGEGVGIYRQGVKALYQATRGLKELDDGTWETFLMESEARMCAAAAGMRAGGVSTQPTTDRCPDRCPYFPLCRGDRYTLARAVRKG